MRYNTKKHNEAGNLTKAILMGIVPDWLKGMPAVYLKEAARHFKELATDYPADKALDEFERGFYDALSANAALFTPVKVDESPRLAVVIVNAMMAVLITTLGTRTDQPVN